MITNHPFWFIPYLLDMERKSFLFLVMLNCNLYAEIFNGMTLYTPIVSGANTHQTYLIDNQTNVINIWTHESGVASIPYLLEDSTLLYPYRVENTSMNAAGVGG